MDGSGCPSALHSSLARSPSRTLISEIKSLNCGLTNTSISKSAVAIPASLRASHVNL